MAVYQSAPRRAPVETDLPPSVGLLGLSLCAPPKRWDEINKQRPGPFDTFHSNLGVPGTRVHASHRHPPPPARLRARRGFFGVALARKHSALVTRRQSLFLQTMPAPLTLPVFQAEAAVFACALSTRYEPSLFAVTDGKAVGTHVEHAFIAHLRTLYSFPEGNSAKGIDIPSLDVDIKVTSVRQPQSSCPFRNARQKIYGLGYSLLIFVYDKTDDRRRRAAKLDILHTVFVASAQTGDFQTPTGLRRLIENQANRDDILAFFAERLLPVDSIEAERLAEEVLTNPPPIGYLTISNALQWRLQYGRAIEQAGQVSGVTRLSP